MTIGTLRADFECFDHLNVVGHKYLRAIDRAIEEGRRKSRLGAGPFRYVAFKCLRTDTRSIQVGAVADVPRNARNDGALACVVPNGSNARRHRMRRIVTAVIVVATLSGTAESQTPRRSSEVMSVETLKKIHQRTLAVKESFVMDIRLTNELGHARLDRQGYSDPRPYRVKQIRLCRPVNNEWYYVTVFDEPVLTPKGDVEMATIFSVKTVRIDDEAFVTTLYNLSGNILTGAARWNSKTDGFERSFSPHPFSFYDDETQASAIRMLQVWSDIVSRIDSAAVASGRDDQSFAKRPNLAECPE